MNSDLERTIVEECISLQLAEYEMIKAMFPCEGEVVASEVKVYNMENSKSSIEYSNLPSFDYNVKIDEYSLHVDLPLLYPTKETGSIYVRSNSFNREEQLCINNELKKHLNSLEDGALIVGYAISWVQEYRNKALDKKSQAAMKNENLPKETEHWEMARYWIVSHHIYSKTKRKDMKALASDFEINGFCLPGKPGVICVEGTLKNVSGWWQRVRSWTWQRIKCIREETKKVVSVEQEKCFYRFPIYKELSSDDIKTKSERSFNMGEFSKYLDQHDSSYVFSELFSL